MSVFNTNSKEPTFLDNDSDEFWNDLFLVRDHALVKPFISVMLDLRKTKRIAVVFDPVTNHVTILVPKQGRTLLWWFYTITALQLEFVSFFNFYQTGRRFSLVEWNYKGITDDYTLEFCLKSTNYTFIRENEGFDTLSITPSDLNPICTLQLSFFFFFFIVELNAKQCCFCQKLVSKHGLSVFKTIPVLSKELVQVLFLEIAASVLFGNKGVLFITVEKFEAGDGVGWILLEAIEATAPAVKLKHNDN